MSWSTLFRASATFSRCLYNSRPVVYIHAAPNDLIMTQDRSKGIVDEGDENAKDIDSDSKVYGYRAVRRLCLGENGLSHARLSAWADRKAGYVKGVWSPDSSYNWTEMGH